MSKLATIEAIPAPPPAVTSDGALILSMIDKLSARPDVPVEKLEQLFELHRKVQSDASKRSYDAAFAEMQPHLPVIDKQGKSHNSKYAKWEDIVEKIQPVTGAHGFGLSFRIAEDANKVRITCILSHRDGHREETSFAFSPDKSGSKNDIQAIGSSISYGKRYAASAILNVVSRDGLEKDNDGATAAGAEPITDEQEAELRDLISATKTDILKFLEVAKAESLSDITTKDFKRLKAFLVKKQERMS